MVGLENALPAAVVAVTLLTAELFFAVAEADKFFSTVIAGQTVWFPATEMVPPLVTALVAAKKSASVTRRL